MSVITPTRKNTIDINAMKKRIISKVVVYLLIILCYLIYYYSKGQTINLVDWTGIEPALCLRCHIKCASLL